MFTTVQATSDANKIDIWRGLHKPIPCPDITGAFNDDTFYNVPIKDNPISIKTEDHPVQASLKTCMAEAKGDAKAGFGRCTPGAPSGYPSA
eukprot:11404999-Ditylum_brightwellii.AAC.1